MKKQLKYIALAFIGVMGLSCEPDKVTEGISDITFFPTFDYKGEELVLAPCGTPFADPGVTATENDVDIPVTKTVTSLMSGGSLTDVPGTADRYTINYGATNKDGYPGSRTREVWVTCSGDLVNSVEGLYTVTVTRDGAGGAAYTNMKYILIRKKSAGVYEVSDAIGLYYAVGRLYGDGYLAPGLQILGDKGSFKLGGSPVVGTFGGAVTPKSITIDKAAKTIVLATSWDAGGGTVYNFSATLKQVSI